MAIQQPIASTLHVYRIRRGTPIVDGGRHIDDYFVEILIFEGLEAYRAALVRYLTALMAARTDPRWDRTRLGEVTVTSGGPAGPTFRLPLKAGPIFYVSPAPMRSLDWYPQLNGVQAHREVMV